MRGGLDGLTLFFVDSEERILIGINKNCIISILFLKKYSINRKKPSKFPESRRVEENCSSKKVLLTYETTLKKYSSFLVKFIKETDKCVLI